MLRRGQLKGGRPRPDERCVGNRSRTMLAALVAVFVVRSLPTDEAAGPAALADAPIVHESGEVLRVETLRGGAGRDGTTGLLVRLVERREDDGALVRHIEVALPGVESVVHHVEERGARRLFVHREMTGTTGRTLRVVDDGGGRASLVTYGEGATLRRELSAFADVCFPLERLEAERTGRAASGPFEVVDPLAGRVETLVAEHRAHALPSASVFGGVVFDVWRHRDTGGAARSLRVFANGRLVAFQPAPGVPLAVALDPEQFDLLRDRNDGQPVEGSPGR